MLRHPQVRNGQRSRHQRPVPHGEPQHACNGRFGPDRSLCRWQSGGIAACMASLCPCLAPSWMRVRHHQSIWTLVQAEIALFRLGLQCVGLSKYGCTELADCCAGSACQRETVVAPGGTCVMVGACVPRWLAGGHAGGWLEVGCAVHISPHVCALLPSHSQCVALGKFGCLDSTKCCTGKLCQRALPTSPFGSCQNVRGWRKV